MLSIAFSESMEMIMWFLLFHLFVLYIRVIGLPILNDPCDPGMNPT